MSSIVAVNASTHRADAVTREHHLAPRQAVGDDAPDEGERDARDPERGEHEPEGGRRAVDREHGERERERHECIAAADETRPSQSSRKQRSAKGAKASPNFTSAP